VTGHIYMPFSHNGDQIGIAFDVWPCACRLLKETGKVPFEGVALMA
jgi:hypothetical protein